MKYKNQKKSILFAILATLCWSTVATAFKFTLRFFKSDIAGMLLYAVFWSFLSLTLVLLVQYRRKPIFRQIRTRFKLSVILGLLNPVFYYVILFKAYDILPAQEAQPLNYTWPIVLSVFSAVLFHQRLSIYDMAGIFISFAGVFVIATQGDIFSLRFSNPLGATLAMSSSVFWASYWILNVKDHLEPVLRLWMNFGFALIILVLFHLLQADWPKVTFYRLLGTAWIGIFEMGITFIFWRKALAYSENTAKTGNIVYLSPFVSLIFLSFILGEAIRLTSVAGLVLIVAGILIQQVFRFNRRIA